MTWKKDFLTKIKKRYIYFKMEKMETLFYGIEDVSGGCPPFLL